MPWGAALIGVLLFAGSLALPNGAFAENASFKVDASHSCLHTRAKLQALVQARAHKQKNVFCILGERHGGDESAWIYWPQEKAMILWELEPYDDVTLASSRRYLHEEKDVVATQDQVGSSSYLVSRPWWDETVVRCKKDGEFFTIRKLAKVAYHPKQISDEERGKNTCE